MFDLPWRLLRRVRYGKFDLGRNRCSAADRAARRGFRGMPEGHDSDAFSAETVFGRFAVEIALVLYTSRSEPRLPREVLETMT